MEERVLSVLRMVFKNNTIDATCSQKNCAAWDSMNHLNLVVELEMETGLEFTPEEIAMMVSYEDIVHIVNNKQ